MPRDTLQAYAATELYNRDWRYHKELKLWFTRATQTEGVNAPSVQYIYFDINQWERRLFTGNIQALQLMTEEEVRIKSFS